MSLGPVLSDRLKNLKGVDNWSSLSIGLSITLQAMCPMVVRVE